MGIEKYIPKVSTGIDGLGFLFGAGTSYESGYPLVSGLTSQVITALSPSERSCLDEILGAVSRPYDEKGASPNIEEIADLVLEHHTNSGNPHSETLKERLRDLVRDAILGVTSPDISNQVAFFEALKKRAYNRPTAIWIFTTNYDLLFEKAAAEVGVKIINGFAGTTYRFFSESEFSLVQGQLRARRFTPESTLSIRLVKLHGSVSWYMRDRKCYEVDPHCINPSHFRCMILPRRSKVIETLSPPYDRLFSVASSALGQSCKYVISSGFSFSDDHINDALIKPRIEGGGIALLNFCVSEPENLEAVRLRPNILHVCEDQVIERGISTPADSNLWKFSEFINLF